MATTGNLELDAAIEESDYSINDWNSWVITQDSEGTGQSMNAVFTRIADSFKVSPTTPTGQDDAYPVDPVTDDDVMRDAIAGIDWPEGVAVVTEAKLRALEAYNDPNADPDAADLKILADQLMLTDPGLSEEDALAEVVTQIQNEAWTLGTDDGENPWLSPEAGVAAWITNGSAGIQMAPQKMDWISLYNHALAFFPEMVTAEDLTYSGADAAEMTNEERIIIGTKQYFDGQRPETETIVRDWGDTNDLYMSEEDQAAYRLYTSDAVGNELTFAQSKSIIRSSERAGIELDDAWMIYSVAKHQGIHVTEPWTGKSAASIAAEKEYNEPGGTGAPDESSDEYAKAWYPADHPDKYVSPTVTGDFSGGMDQFMWGEGYDPTAVSVPELWDTWNKNMAQYDNKIVATVAMSNPDLAGRLAADPWSLTAAEIRTVDELIDGAANWAGVPGESAGASWLMDRMSGENQVIQVDSAGAMEAARTLASAWNMPELSDGLLRTIATGQRQSLLAGIKAQQGNPFGQTLGGPVTIEVPSNLAAAARALRGTPEYATLFANMRSGESEVEYAARFDAAVQKFMGDSDPVLARAGMKTGDPEAVGRAALVSGQAFDNSPFMERLTKMGNAFKEAT